MLDPWALSNSAWKKKLIGRLFANEALQKASCIHALCSSEADSIRAYGINTPVAIIPNGVILPENKEVPERQDERKKLLFLGRIHPKKGLSELLSGWKKSSMGWQLLIAGWDDGGHLDGLQKQADELGLKRASVFTEDADICFLGAIYGDDKDRLLRSVDAFILPSFSEGLPMSVLEAWAYGLPVLMTEFCNIPSGFDAEAALQIEPSADSIAQGLNQLDALSDSDCHTMGAKGRVLVEQHFTWDMIAQEMKSVYEWCLGGEKPTCIQER
jgi:glycosyltransferase involved in cell wall biosynthesis